MPNSYPCDEIFSQHLTTIKDSYIAVLELLTVSYNKASIFLLIDLREIFLRFWAGGGGGGGAKKKLK